MRLIKSCLAVFILASLIFIPGCISNEEGPILVKVVVTPSTASVEIGKTVTLTAVGWDQNNNQMAITPTWKTEGTIGTIAEEEGTSQVTFTAGSTLGTGKVTASVGSRSGSANITVIPVIPVLTTIQITPAGPISIDEGSTQEFTAIGLDQFGAEMEITPTWSVTNEIGSVSPGQGNTTTFTAVLAGNGEITATVGEVTANVQVTVNEYQILSAIELQPVTLQIMETQTQTFVAIGRDQNGDPMEITPTWSLTNNQIGTITAKTANSVDFTATTIGTGMIVATVGNISGSASITVNKFQVLARIELTPQTANLQVGGTQIFEAIGYDDQNQIMPINPSWSLTGSVGTITPFQGPQTTFTATAVGSVNLIATVGEISGNASITITNPAGSKQQKRTK